MPHIAIIWAIWKGEQSKIEAILNPSLESKKLGDWSKMDNFLSDIS